jgi:glycosyltransferase involved in cell wall biosynthesis
MPKVTVIMPVFNGAEYLCAAIDSVTSQTFADWELVVVDDGSTDATPHILQEFSDPRVITIRQENQGEAVARNVGLDAAQGDYIAFLDADDLFLPNALADLAAYLDANLDVDVVFSDGFYCDRSGKPLMRLSEHRPGIYEGNILEALVLTASVLAATICTLTRRCTIEEQNTRFDSNLVIGPDWDFWIHLAHYAQFGYLDRLTCMYRLHDTNVTRTTDHKQRRDDLVKGRLKVMNSDWFEELSVLTRREFFYSLLVDLLSGESDKQREIFNSIQFRNMPDFQRAHILRLVATDYLVHHSEFELAKSCLKQALVASPGDRKSYLLLKLATLGRFACMSALYSWETWHQVRTRLRSIGRAKPKPVPMAFGPSTD